MSTLTLQTAPEQVDAASLDGLRRAVLAARRRDEPVMTTTRDALSALFEAELRTALQEADADRAHEAATALLRRSPDAGRCLTAVARVLSATGEAWADGRCSVAQEHRITATAASVLARLRAGAPEQHGGPVVLAASPGDRHVLALDGLALVLERHGHRVDVVGDLPLDDLLAAARGASAVVLSVHTAQGRDALRPALRALRAEAPGALLVVGGPAVRATTDADLVTSDVDRLLAALATGSCPLSLREREVLRCVADGLSNQEAADVLGVSPATVKTHLDHVYGTTGATGRAAAVAIGLRRGWID